MNSIPLIPRIEDLPYWSSPPVQFVYESTAALAAGVYVWTDAPTVLTYIRPLLPNAVYYFRSVSLVADIAELDFEINEVDVPLFQMYLLGDSVGTPLFREPLLMNKYFDQFEYRLPWTPRRDGDQLLASFNGSLQQGINLIGKTSITLKAVISAQEITDETFVSLFKKHYKAE